MSEKFRKLRLFVIFPPVLAVLIMLVVSIIAADSGHSSLAVILALMAAVTAMTALPLFNRQVRELESELMSAENELQDEISLQIHRRESEEKHLGLNAELRELYSLLDITEMTKARQDAARLASIIEQASEFIIVTDLDGKITCVNPAFEEVTGYMTGDISGRDIVSLAADDESRRITHEFLELLCEGHKWSGRLSRLKSDGTSYTEEISVFPIMDSDGKAINYVSIGRDATIQLELERQLLQAKKLASIGQLAAGIAHEINTPMQYVGDNTEFLQFSMEKIFSITDKYHRLYESAQDNSFDTDLTVEIENALEQATMSQMPSMVDEAISESLEGIHRVTEIVKAMKDFSHMGSGEMSAVDINRAIQSTITVARNEWKYVSDVETGFDETLPYVTCNPGEFNQVILNMITNAAHAIAKKIGQTPDGKGKIRISTRNGGEWAEVRISDTGTGIAANIRERIFDPFFTTKEVGKGTGQGLAIAHQVVVEKHGGSIVLKTEEGEGTTFIIRLPIRQQPEKAEGE